MIKFSTKILENQLSGHSDLCQEIEKLEGELAKFKDDEAKLLPEISGMEEGKQIRLLGALRLKIELLPKHIEQKQTYRNSLQLMIWSEVINQRRNFLQLIAAKRKQLIEKIEKALMPFYKNEKEVKNIVATLDPAVIRSIDRAYNRVQSGIAIPKSPSPEVIETARQFMGLISATIAEMEKV